MTTDIETGLTVTVLASDLRTVLQSIDWNNGDDRTLVGPVDRMGDALALATSQARATGCEAVTRHLEFLR